MHRPRYLLPALVAVVATAIGLGQVPGSAAPAASAAAAEGDDPLEVSIDSLTPSSVPERGRIRMRGTVTNVSDERWRAINVHAFMATEPITSASELAEATETPLDAEVGGRITTPGTFDPVGSLGPGETASFTVRLDRDQLPASAPGVYWFGAHALGNTDAARDGVADGRARTFLPLVPPTRQNATSPLQTSLVVPLRRAVRHRPNGQLRGVHRWARDLGPDGSLDTLLDVATAPGAGPVTWLVDPAVPDAVARLVAGNPPRSLADTEAPEPDDPDTEDPPPDPTAEPVEGEEDEAGTAEPANPAAGPGAAWLGRLRSALAADELLTLPYGDPDLAAVAENDPGYYDRALERRGTQLQQWGLRGTPAVSSLSGYLSPEELGLLRGDETVITSDRVLGEGAEPRPPARIDGARVVFSSEATATGGPGPEEPLGAVALRQRILADASLRLLFHDRAPLVVVLPPAFRPGDVDQFWSGLQRPWLELTDPGDLDTGEPLPVDRLRYPVDEELTQLDQGSFDAADELIATGRTLEGLLTLNDEVADQVLDEALVSLSYHERGRALESRTETVQATEWIQTRLANVRIRAPRGVTLASDAGSFAATVTNRLNHPVTVSIDARSLGGVDVEPPALIQLAPRGRQTVLLEAAATSPGVHYVQLRVTDSEGHSLGAMQRVPIRSAQVSRVIWVILGVGVGLLFLAITIRVFRRVRSEPE